MKVAFIAAIIGVLFISMIAIAYLGINNAPQVESGLLWKQNLENFGTGLDISNNKVYILDIWGNVNCYDMQTGASIWKGSTGGGYFCGDLRASSNRVFGGNSGARIGTLDATTGELKWSVSAPVISSIWSKRPPDSILVLDDPLYLTADGLGVFDAKTGEFLWEYKDNGNQEQNLTNPNWLIGWPFKGSKVFAVGGIYFQGYSFYRLDAANGEILWSRSIESPIFNPPAVNQGQVIIWNSSREQTTILGLNETSGDLLWTYRLESVLCQAPASYGDLLFFGGSDGNFYAFDLAERSLSWKTNTGSKKIIDLANSDNPLRTLPIQIDTDTQRVFWGVGVTTQLGAFVENGNDEYTVFLACLDGKTGSIMWTKQIDARGDVSHESSNFDFAMTKNEIYLAAEFKDLWIFSKTSGKLERAEHFDHYVFSPIEFNGKVFVAADLFLFAYT